MGVSNALFRNQARKLLKSTFKAQNVTISLHNNGVFAQNINGVPADITAEELNGFAAIGTVVSKKYLCFAPDLTVAISSQETTAIEAGLYLTLQASKTEATGSLLTLYFLQG